MGLSNPINPLPPTRSGHVAVTSTDVIAAVVFSSAMPNATYEIFVFGSGILATITISAKTVAGFTMGFTAGISGNLSYLAIGQQ